MEMLKDWTAQISEYQIQASEIKHEFPKVREDRNVGFGNSGAKISYHGKTGSSEDVRSRKC